MRHTFQHAIRLTAGLVLVAAEVVPVNAVPPVAEEYALKATYLFNFTRFIVWPADAFADAKEPFVIGVLGEDPFKKLLDEAVQGEKAAGREIVVRRFKRLEDLQRCHLLFIAQSETARLAAILDRVKGTGCLTVGDSHDTGHPGAVISFCVTNARKVRFEINMAAAEGERLKPNAKLLQIAHCWTAQED